MKYSKEQKLEWVRAYEAGKLDLSMTPMGVKRDSFVDMVRGWAQLSELHGDDAVAMGRRQRSYPARFKLQTVMRVEAGKHGKDQGQRQGPGARQRALIPPGGERLPKKTWSSWQGMGWHQRAPNQSRSHPRAPGEGVRTERHPEGRGIVQSMSRKGNCLDNGIMESFFGTMKAEMFVGHEADFRTFDDLREAVAEYIRWYNSERIMEKTKWMPPLRFREASICKNAQ